MATKVEKIALASEHVVQRNGTNAAPSPPPTPTPQLNRNLKEVSPHPAPLPIVRIDQLVSNQRGQRNRRKYAWQ